MVRDLLVKVFLKSFHIVNSMLKDMEFLNVVQNEVNVVNSENVSVSCCESRGERFSR